MCEGCPSGVQGDVGLPGLYNPKITLADLSPDSQDYKTIVRYATLAKNHGALVVFKGSNQTIGTTSSMATPLMFTEQSLVIDVVKSLVSYCHSNPVTGSGSHRMKVKGNHPLTELLAKKLFGISGVPKEEQERMVSRAIRAAVKWHEERVGQYEDQLAYESASSEAPPTEALGQSTKNFSYT